MVKSVVIGIVIILTMILIYPISLLDLGYIASIGISSESNMTNYTLIKGFGKVKIEDYEKVEDYIENDTVWESYRAIFFNDEQAEKIMSQIQADENWTKEPFPNYLLNKYKNINIDNGYYYLIEIDKDYNIIETNREVLNNKRLEWYKSAIYDSENNVLYYYCVQYKK